MNFELTEEQKDVLKAAEEFARGEFDPDLALELDQAGRFPELIWKKACQLGFVGVHFPEEFGGQGLGLLEMILVAEAFCRVDSGIGSALCAADLGSEILLRYGSQEQKQAFLLPLTRGEKRLTVALTESEDEKDLSFLSTRAEKKTEGYLIQGEKRFVPNASLANTFVVLCQEPEEGWITLVVEQGKGIDIWPVERMGLRMIPLGNLYLKAVQVPLSMRIGGGNEGIEQVRHFFQVRGLIRTAQALGMAEGAFDRAIQYARQREQFGRKLSQFQAIRHKLAEMAVDTEVARWLIYKSVSEYHLGRTEWGFLPIAELETGRRLVRIVDEALQIFGGYGYMAEQAIEHYYRDAWAIGAELGTEEELKDVIAERMLGRV